MSIKKIRTAGTGFVTGDGQPFIARGINMVCKDKFMDYIGEYTSEDFRFLRDHGFNLIRLGIFWDGAEPAPGVYNDEYFLRLDRLINMASSYGIPVFLDMHQDLFGVVFEDGAPKYARNIKGRMALPPGPRSPMTASISAPGSGASHIL